MKKILYIHPTNDFTGSTQVLANVIEDTAIPSTVITDNRKDGCLSRVQNLRIISYCRPQLNGKDIPILSKFVFKLSQLFVFLYYSWRYDVFYINTIRPYYAAIIGRLFNKEIVWHIHEKFLRRPMSVKLYEYVFNHTKAKRIFVSKYLEEQYPRRIDSESEVKYNKLPKTFVCQIKKTPVEKRKRDTILLIGSYSKMKGVYNFVEVAKRLPEYKFILIMSTSPEKANEFRVSYPLPNMEVYPSQSSIHPFLQRADLMTNLSVPFLWVETFGMTILEAMAYGIPSIAPNVGGPLELIENGINGYCLDVTNIDQVVETIKNCLQTDIYKSLSSGCIDVYNKKFA